MIRLNLSDYSDAYIPAKGTIKVPNTAVAGAAVNNTNKNVIFKNWAPFTNCITEINNTQADDGQDIDVLMPMYNLIQYNDAYSKTSGSLWQYFRGEPALDTRDEPALDTNNNIIDFPADINNSTSFNINSK